MEIAQFKSLVHDIKNFNGEEIEEFELMSENELQWYYRELETDTGGLSDWDHLRAIYTLKYRLSKYE